MLVWAGRINSLGMIMRAVAVGLLLAVSGMVGCASIPLSTAVRLSSMSPATLAQVDPSQVRVRIALPQGVELDVASARLNLEVSSDGRSPREALPLVLINTTKETRSPGLFRSDMPVVVYQLRLDETGQQSLRRLRQELIRAGKKTIAMSVDAPFSGLPNGTREVTFWVDTKLSLADAWMPLIDGATVKVNWS